MPATARFTARGGLLTIPVLMFLLFSYIACMGDAVAAENDGPVSVTSIAQPQPRTEAENPQHDIQKPRQEDAGKTRQDAGKPQQNVEKPATAAPEQPQQHSLAEAKKAASGSSVPWYYRLMSFFGIFILLGVAWLFSAHKKVVRWRTVVWGVGLQLIFALLVLKTGAGRVFFSAINSGFVKVLEFTEEGSRFLFGNLVRNNVPVGVPHFSGGASMSPLDTSAGQWAHVGAYFAFNVLPTIIFFSSLMTVLYHLGIMQKLVRGMAYIMQKTMKTSGAESLSAASNVFVGQTEAPLMIRPYVGDMTISELMAVMVGGFATVAGGVMAAYIGMLKGFFPDIGGHLLSASVMSAPAALVVAKLMLPETGVPRTRDGARVSVKKQHVNVIDAAAGGAADGLKLAVNVGAMLLAFIAFIAMLNFLLATIGGWFGVENLSFQLILGYLFWPFAFIMGIPASECMPVAQLLGEKTVINEFYAYLHLANELSAGAALSPRTIVITTYALCGFANFGSIAIQLGGIGGIAPHRRRDLASLGIRAMIGGTIAAFLTAAVAGMLI